MDIKELVKAKLSLNNNRKDKLINLMIISVKMELTDKYHLPNELLTRADVVDFISDYIVFKITNANNFTAKGMPRYLEARLHDLLSINFFGRK